MSPDLRLTYRIVVVMLLIAEALALTGVVRAPHDLWLAELSVANIGTYALFAVVLYFFSSPRWQEARAVAAGGAALAAGIIGAEHAWGSTHPLLDWIFIAGVGFGAAAMAALVLRLRRATGDRQVAKDLLAGCGIAPLADPTVSAYLNLTLAVHPVTFDLDAFRFDASLGFQPSAVLALIAGQAALLKGVLLTAYHFQPYGISMLYAMQRVAARRQPFSIIAFQAVSALLSALLLYHLYPVAGPAYAFGSSFPAALPAASGAEALPLAVVPGARNGVPSMHLAWALALWLAARCLAIPWVRAFFAVWLGLTVISTLALGEHYLVDLVVAVPLVVGVMALCAFGMPWRGERALAACGGLGLTLVWILALRFGAGLWTSIPFLGWPTVLATLAACVAVYRPFEDALRSTTKVWTAESETPPARRDGGPEIRFAVLVFLISGFAALVYQVLFSKVLALTFGSQATATYTVLAVYMGGMALGAWLGGRVAARRPDALRLYAWCELGVGAYCLATPFIFQAIQAIYSAGAGDFSPDAPQLIVLRVVLGSAALLAPTILMGATLPILARYFEGRATSLGVSVAMLYGANTLGAAFGALLAGYALIPALGVAKTIFSAAALNFIVAWLALRFHARTASVVDVPPPATAPDDEAAGVPSLGRLALVILGVGGVVTLALEVNYVHLLAVVAGNSVYAFGLMLFAFLLGLGGGAECARRLLKLSPEVPLALAWLEFLLAAVILGGVYVWEGLPGYFATFESFPLTREFGSREVVRGLACFVAMFPPALVIGAIYPVAMEAVGRGFAGAPIAAMGRAAAINTAGNIVGVLAGGFWLLPAIGALRSIQLLAVICLALGSVALFAAAVSRTRVWAWSPAVAVVILLVVQPRSFDYATLASGANVYFAAQNFGRVIDHAESADGGLTTVTAPAGAGREGLRVLLTNGKFQGTNDLRGEGVAQAGFALSPLLHTAAREAALVIGYGTGMSARVLRDAGYKHLEICDLSADIVRLADTHFSDINGKVSTAPGVRTYITDGRNLLMLRDRRYDLVSLEVSSIWFAGAASLYNREFYQLVKRRLEPHGVLQQWLQLHNIRFQDVLYVLGSVRAEFRYVWVYEIGGQGIVVASDSPSAAPRPAYLEELAATPALAPLFALYGGSVRRLPEHRVLDPEGIDRLLSSFKVPASHWISTDDNLILEYSTPRGNVLDSTASYQYNRGMLRRAAAPSGQ